MNFTEFNVTTVWEQGGIMTTTDGNLMLVAILAMTLFFIICIIIMFSMINSIRRELEAEKKVRYEQDWKLYNYMKSNFKILTGNYDKTRYQNIETTNLSQDLELIAQKEKDTLESEKKKKGFFSRVRFE